LERLIAAIHLAVRFLDDVIDVSRYPLAELEQAARATRKWAWGWWAWPSCWPLTSRISWVVQAEARSASALAAQRRSFPLYAQSTYARQEMGPLRNAQLTLVAPPALFPSLPGRRRGSSRSSRSPTSGTSSAARSPRPTRCSSARRGNVGFNGRAECGSPGRCAGSVRDRAGDLSRLAPEDASRCAAAR
jgi:hypothetical protein